MRNAHLVRALTVAALVALGLGSGPLPASASTLAITSLGCEPRRGGFLCNAYVSGGTGTYSYLWNGGALTGSYNHASGSRIFITCPTGSTATPTIFFKVTDSSGATASQTTEVDCGVVRT